jgi:hypothetical protein
MKKIIEQMDWKKRLRAVYAELEWTVSQRGWSMTESDMIVRQNGGDDHRVD